MILLSRVHSVFFWIAATGSLTSIIFCGLAVSAALRFAARCRSEERQPADFLPPISVLKPLHGAEPGLEESLRSLFRQDYPSPWEILFCARREEDAGLCVARSVAAEFPDRPVRFFACGEPLFPNPKMYSLSIMAEAAAHTHLVTADADARVRPDYLRRCIQALKPGHTARGKQVVLSSCLYEGHVDSGGLSTWLDAAGKSVEMGSGVLIADMFSGTDFALGVSMTLQKEAFKDAGGYQDLGNHWAEDFVLGHRLAALGKGVEMSTHVIELVVADQGFMRSLRDQLRWMQSTRRSRPLGHLGTGLTFAVPFGILGLVTEAAAGRWPTAILFLTFACLNRWLQAFVLLRVLRAKRVAFQTAIYPLRDLLGFVIWCGSYLPADTSYHGTRFRIMPDGRLKPDR